MPLSIESEIDLLYHLSTMSEHVLPKGMFYLLLWKRLNQSGTRPAFTFNEMIEHLCTLYDESVFDNPELPESNDHDFEWQPQNVEQIPLQPQQQQQQQQEQQQQVETEKETPIKPETPSTPVNKTRKRPTSPVSLTPSNENGRRSSRQKPNAQSKDDEEQTATPTQNKTEKRKSVKDSSRISTRSVPNNDSIGTRLRGQK